MAQFDVYANRGEGRGAFPYLLDIQNDLLSDVATRVVVPLADIRHNPGDFGRLTPLLHVEGREVRMMPQQMAAIPVRLLNEPPVARLASERDVIIRAVDVLLSGV